MKNIHNALPGYKIYEYQLVLNPHEDLRNKIMQVKKDFYETYKNSTAVYSKPHIMLVNFAQYEMFEERIINRLKMIGMGFPPVKVELKDYGSFPSHTIFINITSKVPVQDLVKQIRTETQRLMKLDNDNKPHFFIEPHLTIARKLQPWQYEKGWLEYSHKHFTGRFIADSMLLLKRPVDESDSYRIKYQVAQRFEFQNLPVNTTQGNLFGSP
ncbi:MAG: 2'-5' RNA ligase family protein [Ferruginibacter sp.]